VASEKKRLDILLLDRGCFKSREKAKSAIMAGIVSVNGKMVDKAGTMVREDCHITVREDPIPYVSRGGLKLQRALDLFEVDVYGKCVLDIGASTGGFTDCLLQRGAKKVYAVDVGYGQLDWGLRNDKRVVVMERTNIRYVKPEDIGELCDMAVIDVAFISLALVLNVVDTLLKPECGVIALIKPQFEAGRDKVGKGGIVRDAAVHKEVVQNIYEFLVLMGFEIKGLTYSPITGGSGNIEYLIYAGKGKNGQEKDIQSAIDYVIEESHRVFS
jgi:23S rRNA (cytidine1920-2'-O)/16S rRNA (cytidine1409-2'-O)-methyltransferase